MLVVPALVGERLRHAPHDVVQRIAVRALPLLHRLAPIVEGVTKFAVLNHAWDTGSTAQRASVSLSRKARVALSPLPSANTVAITSLVASTLSCTIHVESAYVVSDHVSCEPC